MSQVNTFGASSTPSVPTSFATDSGTATPAANTITIVGDDTSANDNDGITTTGSGSTVTVLLTNRITGTGTTTDGVTPVTIYSFPLGAVPGTYLFTAECVAYDVTDALSSGYTSYAVVRTTGAAGTIISSSVGLITEEGIMSGVSVVNSISGNNLLLEATGLAAKTINYRALTTYTFVS